jgi:hypothetical protein
MMQVSTDKISKRTLNTGKSAAKIKAVDLPDVAIAPKVIRSGRLGTGASFQNLLRSLAMIENVELGILHVVASGSGLQGDVALASGTHILGASTNQATSGWTAMRTIFGLHSVDYRYLDYSGADIGSLDQGYAIKVRQIVDALPCLPELPDDLQGQNTLRAVRVVNLDAIRAAKQAESAKLQLIRKDVKKFEESTMKWRALVMWSLFAIIALGTVAANGLLKMH